MILDEILSGIVRLFGRFFWELILEGFCLYTGRLVLLVFTVGRFPVTSEKYHNWVVLTGMATWIAAILLFIFAR